MQHFRSLGLGKREPLGTGLDSIRLHCAVDEGRKRFFKGHYRHLARVTPARMALGFIGVYRAWGLAAGCVHQVSRVFSQQQYTVLIGMWASDS